MKKLKNEPPPEALWPDPETEYVQSPEFPSLATIARRWNIDPGQITRMASANKKIAGGKVRKPYKGNYFSGWYQKRLRFWTTVRERESQLRAELFAQQRAKVHPRVAGLAWRLMEAIEADLGEPAKKDAKRSLMRLANALAATARELRIAHALELPPGMVAGQGGRATALPSVRDTLLGAEPADASKAEVVDNPDVRNGDDGVE